MSAIQPHPHAAPLPLPDGLDERPVEAYWRISLPTLEELWPGLSPAEREGALRSLGGLIRRVHDVRLPGHGPLFCHPLPEGWARWLREGYGSEPEPFALAFYRAYHLANLGYYSALVGHGEHAREVARALDAEVRALPAAAA